MAGRTRPLNPAAVVLALGLALLTLGTAAVVASRAEGFALAAGDLGMLRFTVVQAALSAAVSVLLAVPVARALARRRFVGRAMLITLMGAPFLLPVLVAVLGLLAVFGRSGVINQALMATGLPPVSIYGLQGVVLAHVFLNLPLAVRMLLQGWQAIPAERFRLAQSLGLGPAGQFRHLEGPMLRATVPGAAGAIFLLCLTSFVVALTLGGGPGATTMELGIYQALRFEGDLGRASLLAAVQFATCGVAVLALARVTVPSAFGAGLDRQRAIPAPSGWRRGADAAAITLAAAFLLVPLAAVVLRGLPSLADLPVSIWAAAARSVAVAVISAGVAVCVALALAQAVAQETRFARLIEVSAMLPMAASGLVLGTGLFVVVQPWVRPETVALPVTVLVNAALAQPFVYRLILPQARALQADYGRLTQAVGLRGWSRLRWVTLPRLARPLGFGAGIAAALSMGDLGVMVLFAGETGATLPVVMHRLMGAFRMDQAAGAAVVLLCLSFVLFWGFDRWGRHVAA